MDTRVLNLNTQISTFESRVEGATANSELAKRETYVSKRWINALSVAREVVISLNWWSLFEHERIPYACSAEYRRIVGRESVPLELPKVTTSWSKTPSAKQRRSPWFMKPSRAFKTIGFMDGYGVSSSIPKFDPWFRDIAKELVPDWVEEAEEKFCRDPCTPERVLASLMAFNTSVGPRENDEVWIKAGRYVEDLFSDLVGTCKHIDLSVEGFQKICEHLDMASSPGLPFSREFRVQAECLDMIYDAAKRLNHFAKFLPPDQVRAPPCMVAVRPGLLEKSELSEKIKARGVWAFPAAVKVMEKEFGIPIYDRFAQLRLQTPYTTGVNNLKALPMIIDHLIKDGKFGCVTDVSHMDASCHVDDINWAFDVMKTWINFGCYESERTRANNIYEFLRYYFIRTPILLPNGQLVRKYTGVPSGSEFTQLVDTLISTRLAVYALLRQGYKIMDIEGSIFSCGDDVAVSVKSDFSIEEYATSLKLRGYTINVSKVMFSQKLKDLKFLGYSVNGAHVYRDDVELFKIALFPERMVGSMAKSFARIVGQYIASAMCSQAFKAVLQSYDRKMLQLGQKIDTTAFSESRTGRFFEHVLGIDSIPKQYDDLSILSLI